MESPSTTKNYYTVLQIRYDSTQQQINAAYKRLVLLHHPDKSGGNTASANEFRQIQEAIEVLRDPNRRRLHDQKLQLQFTNTPSPSKRRGIYYATDDRRNWYKEDSTWSTGRREWNFNDPADRYQFTFGTCVHMDPESEASREELARHENDLEEWEMRYAGIDPEVEKAKAEFYRETMQAGGARDEKKSGDLVQPDEQGPDHEEKQAEKYTESTNESTPRKEDELHDTLGEKNSNIYPNSVEILPHARANIKACTMSVPTQTDPGADCGCLIDLSDSEHPKLTSDGYYSKANEAYEFFGPLAPAIDNMPQYNPKEDTSELLQPFMPFFRTKLGKHNSQYSEDDMHAEIQGLVLEISGVGLEGVGDSYIHNQSFKGGLQPCLHMSTWDRLPGMPVCPKCHLWMPVLVLTCPGCGTQACPRCKFTRKE